jgi:hypothetical protein
MKKSFLSFLAIPIFIATPTIAKFSDVYENFHYSEAIYYAEENNTVSGYSDGTFRPENKINRAEFTKIIVEVTIPKNEITGRNCFRDVKEEWFAKYICTAKEKGIINGFKDETFKPTQNISFVEASKIISLAFGDIIMPDNTEWFKAFVKNLENKKAIPHSILSFDYKITRQDMVEMIWRVKTKQKKESLSFDILKTIKINEEKKTVKHYDEKGKLINYIIQYYPRDLEYYHNEKIYTISNCLVEKDKWLEGEELGMEKGKFCPHIINFSFPMVVKDYIILRASHKTFMQGELLDTTGIFLIKKSNGKSKFFTLYGLFNKKLLERSNLDNKTIFFFDFKDDKIVIKERVLNLGYQYEEIIRNKWKESWFLGIQKDDFYIVNWGYPDEKLYNISMKTNKKHSISYEDIFKNFDIEGINKSNNYLKITNNKKTY